MIREIIMIMLHFTQRWIISQESMCLNVEWNVFTHNYMQLPS